MRFKIILLLVSAITYIVTGQNQHSIQKINLERFSVPNESIRAIEVLNDSLLSFATSNGTIGFINAAGKITLHQIKHDTISPNFRALAISNDIYALSIGNPALLYQIKNEKGNLVYKETHKKVFYDAMQFFNKKNGIAMGDPTENCLSIIITDDGGNSWSKIPCNQLPKTKDGEAAFAASNTNIAIVDTNAWVVTGGTKARVFHTKDMGKTWKVYNTPIVQGKSTTGIYTVDFYNKNIGIICGGDYTDKFGNYANKAITTNGGKTWQVVSENTAPKYVSCVQYVPETSGKEVFAVSTNGIFYSNNGGENWEKVSSQSFYSIRFVNKSTAWLSGNGVIAKMTTD